MLAQSKQNTTSNYRQLSDAVRMAIGYRTIGQFAIVCNMVDTRMIENLLDSKLCEYPHRQILRRIALASQGRVSYEQLYQICGYSEQDDEEYEMIKGFFPKRGEIYLADLGLGTDSEQGGIRPVIVIQNDVGNKHSPTLCIVPVTTKKKTFSKTHVHIPTEFGMKDDSYALTEQIRCISKRRLYYNSLPWRISTLPERKMQEIQNALEIELGFEDVMFNENKAYEMLEHIKALKRNVHVKKAFDLESLLIEKINEYKEYCARYEKDYSLVLTEYNRLNKVSYAL